MLARFESLKIHVEREECVLHNIVFRVANSNQSADKTSNRCINYFLQSIERCAIIFSCLFKEFTLPTI